MCWWVWIIHPKLLLSSQSLTASIGSPERGLIIIWLTFSQIEFCQFQPIPSQLELSKMVLRWKNIFSFIWYWVLFIPKLCNSKSSLFRIYDKFGLGLGLGITNHMWSISSKHTSCRQLHVSLSQFILLM